ncbi:MAG: glycosyltransferase [Minisyncoccia bacterium]
MRVLAIGSDKSIAVPDSASAKRQVAYGMRFGDLRIIIFSLVSQKLVTYALSVETHAYPTASSWRGLYGWNAFWIALKLPKSDVVTVQDPFETGLIGWIIARVHRAGFHVQVHTDFLSPHFKKHSLLNRVRTLLASFVLRRADRIRVVSRSIKESIEREYALKAPITVLPIFVDVERFKSAGFDSIAGRFSKFETKLLVVARLEPEKNVALAIKAFASAPESACLIILDEGSEKKELEQLVTDLKLSDRVFFEGKQDPAPYYALADLILVPSHFEGYGLVIVEALAAGKPVLATDVGIAREAGAIITSPENFSDALVDWIKDGTRVGQLRSYPYMSFEEYIDAYCNDIASAQKSQALPSA